MASKKGRNAAPAEPSFDAVAFSKQAERTREGILDKLALLGVKPDEIPNAMRSVGMSLKEIEKLRDTFATAKPKTRASLEKQMKQIEKKLSSITAVEVEEAAKEVLRARPAGAVQPAVAPVTNETTTPAEVIPEPTVEPVTPPEPVTLPQEKPLWKKYIEAGGDIVGESADGTRIAFDHELGSVVIKRADGTSEIRPATFDEVKNMFVAMSAAPKAEAPAPIEATPAPIKEPAAPVEPAPEEPVAPAAIEPKSVPEPAPVPPPAEIPPAPTIETPAPEVVPQPVALPSNPHALSERIQNAYLKSVENIKSRGINPKDMSPEAWETIYKAVDTAKKLSGEYRSAHGVKEKEKIVERLQRLTERVENGKIAQTLEKAASKVEKKQESAKTARRAKKEKDVQEFKDVASDTIRRLQTHKEGIPAHEPVTPEATGEASHISSVYSKQLADMENALRAKYPEWDGIPSDTAIAYYDLTHAQLENMKSKDETKQRETAAAIEAFIENLPAPQTYDDKGEPIVSQAPAMQQPTTVEANTQVLQDKLAEYRDRLTNAKYQAPEELEGTAYRAAVLENLLNLGHIDAPKIEAELRTTYGNSFSEDAFRNAVAVIDDYAKTGGKNVNGGTGLKGAAPVVPAAVAEPKAEEIVGPEVDASKITAPQYAPRTMQKDMDILQNEEVVGPPQPPVPPVPVVPRPPVPAEKPIIVDKEDAPAGMFPKKPQLFRAEQGDDSLLEDRNPLEYIVPRVTSSRAKSERTSTEKKAAPKGTKEKASFVTKRVRHEDGLMYADIIPTSSIPVERTPGEWRTRLSALIRGAGEKIGRGAEKTYQGLDASVQYLKGRSDALGSSLWNFGARVIGDFKVGGLGIARTIAHPMEALHKGFSGIEKAAAYGKYLTDKNVSQNERLETLSKDIKKLLEGYNKLPPRQKAYIVAGLIGGSSVAAVAGLPTLSTVLAGGMYGQRALGGAGLSLNLRKSMDVRAQDPEHWLAKKSRAYKNTYAGVLGVAYMGATAVAGHYAMDKLANWLGNVFGHSTPVDTAASAKEGAAAVAPTPAAEVSGAPLAEGVGKGVAAAEAPVATGAAATTEAQEIARTVAESAAEVPQVTVAASPGHGYEYMMKRVWEQLQDKNLDPTKYPERSDLRLLLEADDTTIDTVVHQIAKDPRHAFYNADGTSARIGLDSHMSINADGAIMLDDAVKVAEGTPTTPVYPPEVPRPPIAPNHEDLASQDGTAETSPAEANENGESGENETEQVPAPKPPEEIPLSRSAEVITPPPGAEAYAPPPNQPPPPGFETAPASTATTEVVSNKIGLSIPTNESHLYASAVGREMYVFGGTHTERVAAMSEYWKKNPFGVIIGPDAEGANRVAWFLKEGKVMSGPPIRTNGFLGIFGSTFLKPPGPEDLKSLIK